MNIDHRLACVLSLILIAISVSVDLQLLLYGILRALGAIVGFLVHAMSSLFIYLVF